VKAVLFEASSTSWALMHMTININRLQVFINKCLCNIVSTQWQEWDRITMDYEETKLEVHGGPTKKKKMQPKGNHAQQWTLQGHRKSGRQEKRSGDR